MVKIVPQPSAKALAEVSVGELRIGKELNAFQQILKTWYFTCYTLGTAIFASFYFLLWTILQAVWEDRRWRKRRYMSEEPPCDLGSDFNFEDLSFGPAEQQSRRASSWERGAQHFRSSGGSSDDEWEDLYYDTNEAAFATDAQANGTVPSGRVPSDDSRSC